MTRVRMLCFTRRYKENIQERLMILISLCLKFTGVRVCPNHQNRALFDKVIAKIKLYSFLAHSVLYICSNRAVEGVTGLQQ